MYIDLIVLIIIGEGYKLWCILLPQHLKIENCTKPYFFR
jgi:hypothetical protein